MFTFESVEIFENLTITKDLLLEKNVVFSCLAILIGVGIYVIVFQFGIINIITKLMKQISLMFLMAIVCFIWLALFNNHCSDINSGSLTDVSSAFVSKNYSIMLENTKFVTSISEIILISGFCVFILSMLYRQLPIDLIPDCLPYIGKCDNMLAGFFAFIGIVITSIGIYLQLHYADTPNTTANMVQSINKNMNNTKTFWNKNEQEKMNILQEFLFIFFQKLHFLLKQLFEQIQKNFGK